MIVRIAFALSILALSASRAVAAIGAESFVTNWQECVGSRLTRGIVNRKARNVYFSDQTLVRDSKLDADEISAVREARRPLSLVEGRVLSPILNAHVDWLLCVDMIRERFGADPDGVVNDFEAMPYAFETVARHALRLPPATPRPERPAFAEELPGVARYKVRFVPKFTPLEYERIWRQRVARRLVETIMARWDDRETRITNKDIERAVGIHASRLSEVRQAKKTLSLEQGFAIAKLFGIDGRWLLDFSGLRRQFQDPSRIAVLHRSDHRNLIEVAKFALGLTTAEAVRERPRPGPRMKGCAPAFAGGISHVELPQVHQTKLVSQD